MILFPLLVQAGLILYQLKKEIQALFTILLCVKSSKQKQKKFLLITIE